MTTQSSKNTLELSRAIKERRQELGLTIEAAASKAGVGTKTWCRYEAGESIRTDKVKGLCRALNWNALPEKGTDVEDKFDLDEYKNNKAWSEYISCTFGIPAAVSFIIGSELLIDYISEDMHKLSSLPKGTHIGQLQYSMLEYMLPKQFLMEYDYEFLYKLKCVVNTFRRQASFNTQFVAHSVIEELALYIIVDASELLMESLEHDMEEQGIKDVAYWREWIYDIFDDADIETCLYSDMYVSVDHIYHFKYWYKDQFFMK